MTNKELQSIYFGAYSFKETEDGWLQAFQYTDEQMAYFSTAFDFWYDRCMATTAKTLEFITEARKVSFEYKIIWMEVGYSSVLILLTFISLLNTLNISLANSSQLV